MYENHQTGAPLMRPLFFEEPDNEMLFDYSAAYLWGQDILVAPILKAGVEEQEVYFPKTANWFDFYTDEKFEGGVTQTVQVMENSIPTFVRGGSFMPMAKIVQSTKLHTAGTFELHYYFDASVSNSEREFYNDAGNGIDLIEKGDYELVEYEANYNRNKLKFEFELEAGSHQHLSGKSFELVVHNIQNAPRRIKINHKKIPVNWDAETKTLKIPIIWANTSEDIDLKIKLKK
jgi:alpha-glucosidase (family GH31 glycosyl hydrolase)